MIAQKEFEVLHFPGAVPTEERNRILAMASDPKAPSRIVLCSSIAIAGFTFGEAIYAASSNLRHVLAVDSITRRPQQYIAASTADELVESQSRDAKFEIFHAGASLQVDVAACVDPTGVASNTTLAAALPKVRPTLLPEVLDCAHAIEPHAMSLDAELEDMRTSLSKRLGGRRLFAWHTDSRSEYVGLTHMQQWLDEGVAADKVRMQGAKLLAHLTKVPADPRPTEEQLKQAARRTGADFQELDSITFDAENPVLYSSLIDEVIFSDDALDTFWLSTGREMREIPATRGPNSKSTVPIVPEYGTAAARIGARPAEVAFLVQGRFTSSGFVVDRLVNAVPIVEAAVLPPPLTWSPALRGCVLVEEGGKAVTPTRFREAPDLCEPDRFKDPSHSAVPHWHQSHLRLRVKTGSSEEFTRRIRHRLTACRTSQRQSPHNASTLAAMTLSTVDSGTGLQT